MTDNRIQRRTFLRLAATAGFALVPGRRLLGAGGGAVALRIGIVLPADHPALPGIRLGGEEAAQAAGLFRSDFGLHEAHAIDADVAAAAARLVRKESVHALIGGASPAAADALADTAAASDILFMNIGAPPESLAQPCDSRTFHIHASDAMRRAALEHAGKGVAGVRALAWHPSLSRFGAAQVNERYGRAVGEPLAEPAWNGWIAVKILFDAAQRAGTTDAAELTSYLESERAVFDGHKGIQLSFRPQTHRLRQPLYVVADDRVLAEVPSPATRNDMTPAELLDSLVTDGEPCTR